MLAKIKVKSLETLDPFPRLNPHGVSFSVHRNALEGVFVNHGWSGYEAHEAMKHARLSEFKRG